MFCFTWNRSSLESAFVQYTYHTESTRCFRGASLYSSIGPTTFEEYCSCGPASMLRFCLIGRMARVSGVYSSVLTAKVDVS